MQYCLQSPRLLVYFPFLLVSSKNTADSWFQNSYTQGTHYIYSNTHTHTHTQIYSAYPSWVYPAHTHIHTHTDRPPPFVYTSWNTFLPNCTVTTPSERERLTQDNLSKTVPFFCAPPSPVQASSPPVPVTSALPSPRQRKKTTPSTSMERVNIRTYMYVSQLLHLLAHTYAQKSNNYQQSAIIYDVLHIEIITQRHRYESFDPRTLRAFFLRSSCLF